MRHIVYIFLLCLTALPYAGFAAIQPNDCLQKNAIMLQSFDKYDIPIIIEEDQNQPNIFASFKTYVFESIASEIGYIHNLPYPMNVFPLGSLRDNNKFISLIDGIYADITAAWHKDDYVGQINALYKQNIYDIFPGLYWATRTNFNIKASRIGFQRNFSLPFEETRGHMVLEAALGCQLIDVDNAHLSLSLLASGNVYRSYNTWGFAPALGLGINGKLSIWQVPHRSVQAFFASEFYAKSALGADWHIMTDFEDISPLANPMAQKVSSTVATLGYFDEILGFAIKLGITTLSTTSKTFSSSNATPTLTPKLLAHTIEPYIGVDVDTSFKFADHPTRLSFRGTPRGLEAKVGFTF